MQNFRRALCGMLLALAAVGISAMLGACASEAKEHPADSGELTWGSSVDQALSAFESEG